MFYSHIKGIGTSCLKLMQLYQWDILKQNFFVATVLDMENFQLNILQKKMETCFRWLPYTFKE